ncbi:hypothetical protein QWZ13_18930 [Reinekea marina]|uniref:DUF4382 domain-containing protein n=1 Tax=Reinekea marina TaxID=1310421 RepID=A0ABV7WRJ6_9GAMM|nr:hypothetical protein [Reinekea marina]MDN3650988.1 hypothetical protein [Reinekea marina]
MNNFISKKLVTVTLFSLWFITGCASVPLSSTEPDKLTVNVSVVAEEDRQTIDIFLKRGFWGQPVRLDSADDALLTVNSGETKTLVAARKDGRYGLKLKQGSFAQRLDITGVGGVNVPPLPQVVLTDKETLENQVFFKSDQLILRLNESSADKRHLAFSVKCGRIISSTNIDISKSARTYSLSMADIMRRLNNSAEADLTGMLPIKMSLVESAIVNWPPPFVAQQLIAKDSTDFFIDTSGFKFTGSITIKPSSAVSLLLTNRKWPVTYCY